MHKNGGSGVLTPIQETREQMGARTIRGAYSPEPPHCRSKMGTVTAAMLEQVSR